MSHTKEVLYFEGEGRDCMPECLERSFQYAKERNIGKIVIFTGSGEGPVYALQNFLSRPEYSAIRVIAVTPPVGRPYRADPNDPNSPIVRAGISESVKDLLSESGVPVIAAHLPFRGIQVGEDRVSEWSRVSEAFGILGGGFALCIQSILIACDAGEVDCRERVVALTADTSVVAWASRTESFLSPRQGLIVEHIITRPVSYNISKPEHWMTAATVPALAASSEPTRQESFPNVGIGLPHAFPEATQRPIPSLPAALALNSTDPSKTVKRRRRVKTSK